MARRRTAMRLQNGDSVDTPKFHQNRLDQLVGERTPHLTRWDSLQRYVAPRLNRQFKGQKARTALPDHDAIIDSTGTQALGTLSAGMMAGITSPARRWRKSITRPVAPGEPMPEEYVKYLQYLDDLLFRFWDRSDLYGMLANVYVESPLFGTACGYGASVPGAVDFEPFVWRSIPAGQYVIAEGANGMVDTIYREFTMTVGQIVERFPPDKISPRVMQLWRSGQWNDRVDLVQHFGLTPWVERYLGRRGQPMYQEVVFERDYSEKRDEVGGYLSRTEFQVFPAFCVRWEKDGVSPWGVGPGDEALPDIKQLQEMEDKKGVALSIMVSPPLQGPPELENQRISSLPGDVTFVQSSGTGKDGVRPIYEVQPRLTDFVADEDQVRQRIRRSFFADLFTAFLNRTGVQPLNEEEIWERKEEKLLVLGPVLDRLDRECLRPITEISLDYLASVGQLEDPPDGLEEVETEYLNIIAVAQHSQGLTAISDVASFITTLAQAQAAAGREPTALDRLNVDESIRLFNDKRGGDVRLLRDDDDVEALQEQRAEQQARIAQLEAEQQQAATAKDMAAAEELAARSAQDQGPLASGGGPGTLPPDMGALAP